MENRIESFRITPYIFTALPLLTIQLTARDLHRPSQSAAAGAFRSTSSSLGSGKG